MKRLMLSVLVSPVILLSACWGDGEGYRRSLAITQPLNDTGISLCGDYAFPDATHNNSTGCQGATQTVNGEEVGNGDDPIPAGQDAHFGRDASDDNDDADGFKGFSFTKLKFDGTALPVQTNAWSFDGSGFDNGSEVSSTQWKCVKDNITGLIWEVKTNRLVANIHDKDYTYSWYNQDNTQNGGSVGTPDSGNNCFSTLRCDTAKYVADVNALNICGETGNDWRLPTRAELKSLRHLGAAILTIESNYFPNTRADFFWTSSPVANSSASAWLVDFITGPVFYDAKSSAYYVRLVRDAE